MPGTSIMLSGDLAVVWCRFQDRAPDTLALLQDLRTDSTLKNFAIEIDVSGGDYWILYSQGFDSKVSLYRYIGGSGYAHDIPTDLHEALSPPEGIPASVWARSVAEAHEHVCRGEQNGCGCVQARKWLAENNLLL